MRRFIRRFLHHWTCNRTFSFPYDADCGYWDCGNWLDNAITRVKVLRW